MTPSLTTLPPEIKYRIAGYLAGARREGDSATGKGDLPGYANRVAKYTTISKEWQEIFESFVFKDLFVTSTRLPYVASVINAKRLKYLDQIFLLVQLPATTMEGCGRAENDDEKARNSKIVDSMVSSLFNSCLVAWKRHQVSHSGITLQIRVMAPTDYIAMAGTSRWGYHTIHGGTMVNHRSFFSDVGTRSFEDSFLELSTPLPQAECISTLKMGDVHSTRNFSAYAYGSLLRALPSLQDVKLHTFAVRNARLCHRQDNNLIYTRLMTTERGVDTLSCTLREISYGLTTLQVLGPIGPQFFWPLGGSKKAQSNTHWPRLKSLGAHLHFVQPGGTYLFKHTIQNRQLGRACQKCVWEANSGPLNKLYSAVAKAASKMPKLEVLALRVMVAPGPLWHEFRFQLVDGRRAYLCWISDPLFEPSEEVLRLWKEVADARDLALNVVIARASPSEQDYVDNKDGTMFIREYENEEPWNTLPAKEGEESADNDDDDDDDDD
ncbi:hypothetical protein SLS62_002326 [Diatrype stigma]|uniref:DUF6546 domain-containing protein n=1 Tax=Diatrype stigma TaxID=117547 RepID=A0AAN9V712_9PEZI